MTRSSHTESPPTASYGNGVLEAGEVCDGPDLGSINSCLDLSYSGSEAVTCMLTCQTFDVSACSGPPASCGSGTRQSRE